VQSFHAFWVRCIVSYFWNSINGSIVRHRTIVEFWTGPSMSKFDNEKGTDSRKRSIQSHSEMEKIKCWHGLSLQSVILRFWMLLLYITICLHSSLFERDSMSHLNQNDGETIFESISEQFNPSWTNHKPTMTIRLVSDTWSDEWFKLHWDISDQNGWKAGVSLWKFVGIWVCLFTELFLGLEESSGKCMFATGHLISWETDDVNRKGSGAWFESNNFRTWPWIRRIESSDYINTNQLNVIWNVIPFDKPLTQNLIHCSVRNHHNLTIISRIVDWSQKVDVIMNWRWVLFDEKNSYNDKTNKRID
jgi:hypothetical protein